MTTTATHTTTAPAAAPAPAAPGNGVPAVTGIGVTAPNGLGTETWWANTLNGTTGIRPLTRFDPASYPARLAGEVPGFDPAQHIPSRLLPQTDHMTRLALTAADEALADAGIDTAALPPYAAGVITASSAGGFEFGQRELQALWSKGGQYVSAYQSFAWFYAVNTGQISIKNGLRGPSGVIVTEQAGGLDAIAAARRQLRKGIQLLVTGGVDSSLCPWGWAAHLATGDLSTATDPDRAYLPFDDRARGHVNGEGGALLIVEDEARARARGATSYGTIAGYAATFDAPPHARATPRLADAARLALADAGAEPGDIDAVFADAAGTRDLDRAEADAITAVFGPRAVPVTAPKTMTGRLAAGGAPLDVAAALLAIRDQVIPPTVNTAGPAADCPIDLVRRLRRPARLRTALVLARGRGGFNAAMIVRAP
ncbi:ketosynthase chain-length factor [Streptomyces sp. CAU 1734]|uniref:ketosynthase chain-length factor n=1 Tax=Streptomyces sp. CAU 1734 TaxID=3140360 RepID=UPI00326051FC